MMTARGLIEAIYRTTISDVDPRARVRHALQRVDGGSQIAIEGTRVSIPDAGVYVIAIGKAAPAMANGAVEALGGDLRGGIVVTKEARTVHHPSIDVLEGAHPVPDERSLAAGRYILEFVRQIPRDALVLCLISGGGSALVESLRPGVSLDRLQDITSQILASGATIHELNAVRSRLSALKGGGLLSELRHATVINLIVSDVLGDDLTVIASGPTIPRAGGMNAEDVLASYGMPFDLPPPIPHDPQATPLTSIIANVRTAVDAAARSALDLGWRPVVLTTRLDGEAREVGRVVAAIAAGADDAYSPLGAGCCLLAGGETTVTLRGDGVGGRNTEAALAAALSLAGGAGVTLGFLATDGDDGVSGAAGAIVDGATINAGNRRVADQALERNDSFGFLAGAGATWSPGATGTNVNDLVIGVIEAK